MGGTDLKRPLVGVACLVWSPLHKNCILLGRRKGTILGAGLYQLPGGHLEYGESLVDCAARETLEETALKIKNCRYGCVVNSYHAKTDKNRSHYVTFFLIGELDASYNTEPVNTEPDKNEGWNWTSWDNMPHQDQLFYALATIVKEGFDPFSHRNLKFGLNVPVNGMPNYTYPLISSSTNRPTVFVSVFITNPHRKGCFLLNHEDLYKLPGGLLEFCEDFETCASRVVKNILNIEVNNVSLLRPVNSYCNDSEDHFIDIILHAEVGTENDKIIVGKEWFWCSLENLPRMDQLTQSLRTFITQDFHKDQMFQTINIFSIK